MGVQNEASTEILLPTLTASHIWTFYNVTRECRKTRQANPRLSFRQATAATGVYKCEGTTKLPCTCQKLLGRLPGCARPGELGFGEAISTGTTKVWWGFHLEAVTFTGNSAEGSLGRLYKAEEIRLRRRFLGLSVTLRLLTVKADKNFSSGGKLIQAITLAARGTSVMFSWKLQTGMCQGRAHSFHKIMHTQKPLRCIQQRRPA